MLNFTKNENVVLYIIANRLWCSITEIVKLCYLLDLWFLKEYDKKITDFDYIRYTYWPFDPAVYTVVNGLVSKWLLRYVCYPMTSWDEICKYELNSDENIKYDLQSDDIALIDEMLSSLSAFNAHELTKLAYKTKPMTSIDAKLWGNEHMWEPLNLNIVKSA